MPNQVQRILPIFAGLTKAKLQAAFDDARKNWKSASVKKVGTTFGKESFFAQGYQLIYQAHRKINGFSLNDRIPDVTKADSEEACALLFIRFLRSYTKVSSDSLEYFVIESLKSNGHTFSELDEVCIVHAWEAGFNAGYWGVSNYQDAIDNFFIILVNNEKDDLAEQLLPRLNLNKHYFSKNETLLSWVAESHFAGFSKLVSSTYFNVDDVHQSICEIVNIDKKPFTLDRKLSSLRELVNSLDQKKSGLARQAFKQARTLVTHDTLLHVAARQGEPKLVDFLLSLGLDRAEINDAGQTALEVAKNKKTKKALMFLGDKRPLTIPLSKNQFAFCKSGLCEDPNQTVDRVFEL